MTRDSSGEAVAGVCFSVNMYFVLFFCCWVVATLFTGTLEAFIVLSKQYPPGRPGHESTSSLAGCLSVRSGCITIEETPEEHGCVQPVGRKLVS